MNIKTHVWGGIMAGEIMAMTFNAGDADIKSACFILFSAIGAMLPDIDHPKSTISNANIVTKAASGVTGVVTKHRGVLHTPFVPLVLGLLLFVTNQYMGLKGFAQYIYEGLIAGYLSHLILDILNPTGIMLLWPIYRKHIHLANIRTGSRREHRFKVLLTIGCIVMLCVMCITDILVSTRGYR